MINKIRKYYKLYLDFFASKKEILFFVLLSCLLIYRIYLLLVFGIQYVDSDQAIMWLATTDYAQGIFHEPCFYGQSYLIMIEALFASILFIFSVPLNIGLPLVTSMLAITPFLVIAWFAYKQGNLGSGMMIISLPLLLPVEYDLLTSIPRGFVGGIALAGIAMIPFYKHSKKGAIFLFTLLSMIALVVNPNAILLVGPCALFLFVKYRTKTGYYISTLGGVLIGMIVYLLVHYFYQLNPSHNLHKFDLSFNFINIVTSLSSVDKHFNYVTPIFWKMGVFILLFPIPFIIFNLRKRNFEVAIFAASLLILILLSLGISKIHDGTNSIFMSYTRMFLAVPISFAVLLLTIKNTSRWHHIIIFTVSLFFMVYKTATLQNTIEKHSQSSTIVTVIEVGTLSNVCYELYDISNKHQVELIVIVNHWLYDLYNYGCPAIIPDFPPTIRPSYERRTWRLVEDADAVYPTILLISDNVDFSINFDFVESVPEKEGLFLIENNKLSTLELFESLGIKVRAF